MSVFNKLKNNYAARNLTLGEKDDIWAVNIEEKYHEEKSAIHNSSNV